MSKHINKLPGKVGIGARLNNEGTYANGNEVNSSIPIIKKISLAKRTISQQKQQNLTVVNDLIDTSYQQAPYQNASILIQPNPDQSVLLNPSASLDINQSHIVNK